ncbi:MAG: hypothetical protein QJR12_17485 [Mycobacterium sp.]|uniref:hypothetical protein n=1 Tax=Mycobacterium sp. TaxID=1785 RepID=UPI00262D796E|nr:hypothetical protein [Mycobacterium sp.]MDI3315988.1 hypothetical protein [Mycobacterium sp.]
MGIDPSDRQVTELIDRYNKWRRVYQYAGKGRLAPDEPDWENGRLYFRRGYPYPDWTAYIIESDTDENFRVLHASTERRNTPIESLQAVFSRIEDAGKFIIYETVTDLRADCRMQSTTRKWRAQGLDPNVEKVMISDKQAKYILRSDPKVYFIAYSGGIQPYNHILPISYDELDAVLLEDFPENVTSRLAAESNLS